MQKKMNKKPCPCLICRKAKGCNLEAVIDMKQVKHGWNTVTTKIFPYKIKIIGSLKLSHCDRRIKIK